MNRLARERSPYLLQHAENPVEWFPWGEEAFAKSSAEGKPIFLSIGYSTCHWCHVMEHESFENAAVAKVLNDEFVAIKVDREERPDVDRVYMTFVQATTGSGGWPMSVWLTPDLKPFYGGTYFPPTSRWGRPGFVDILREIARVWKAERDKVLRSAEGLTAQLKEVERATAAAQARPTAEALTRTVSQFHQTFDWRHCGFGEAPKFPRPSELLFLLREFARTGETFAREMAMKTLRAMAMGGLRDHVGGGFHRYSVDAAWRVPHFEKMLYDQAQLVLANLEAAQASGDQFHLDVAEDTLQYVMRQMTDAEGGFYSAEDADSVPPEQADVDGAHKTEGAFYLWRAAEVDTLLGSEAEIVKQRFGVEANGNAPSDPQQEFAGKNLLYVARSIDEIAGHVNRPADEVAAVLQRARVRLFERRLTRPRPHLDDKVLTAWNGLMIAAFARMARVGRGFGDQTDRASAYLHAARRAATFVKLRLWQGERATLLRRFRDGKAEIDAYAEDYAYLVFGLLELFQADGDPAWLEWAIVLQERQNALFWDDADGGWFSTTGQDPRVLLRMKEDYDGAEPSANSISVLNLLLLSHLLENPDWARQIDRTLQLFGQRLEQLGRAVPMMSAALSVSIAGVQQVVLVGADSARADLAAAVARRYLPFTVTIDVRHEYRDRLVALMPFLGSMKPASGAAAAYVCQNFTCRAPVATVEELEGTLA